MTLISVHVNRDRNHIMIRVVDRLSVTLTFSFPLILWFNSVP